jgi:hypothetical protein
MTAVTFAGVPDRAAPQRRRGCHYPWLVRSTAMVNHFYIYFLDRDFGLFFLKFCTWFP